MGTQSNTASQAFYSNVASIDSRDTAVVTPVKIRGRAQPAIQRRHANILSTIGKTPVVRINQLAPAHVNMFVKIEAFNPLGSVKDRLALGIIVSAERDGSLQPGQTVIEATSGNTGIGLAMVCAQKGYPLVVTMAENFSIERRRLMRYLGAKVILTPASEKGSGMLAKACELADKHGWFLCRQFENEANANIHSETTAPEILASDIEQEYAPSGSPSASHPEFRPHLMQGWTPDFVSKLTQDVISQNLIDQIVPVAGNEALRCARDLAQREGIFCGISGGATLAGALTIADQAEPGANILCMLPDTGERYQSTPLFADIADEMSGEELALSQTTPGFRFDAPPKTTNSTRKSTPIPVEPAAATYIDSIVKSKDHPVVLFSLEWCEFCWSIRKLFAALGLEYRSVDLDSVEYQRNNWGGHIRVGLQHLTQVDTIPQLFVAGQYIGGCTETFDAFKAGRLQELLSVNKIRYHLGISIDPYNLLPSWLHPR